jgi:hypothetical protein
MSETLTGTIVVRHASIIDGITSTPYIFPNLTSRAKNRAQRPQPTPKSHLTDIDPSKAAATFGRTWRDFRQHEGIVSGGEVNWIFRGHQALTGPSDKTVHVFGMPPILTILGLMMLTVGTSLNRLWSQVKSGHRPVRFRLRQAMKFFRC